MADDWLARLGGLIAAANDYDGHGFVAQCEGSPFCRYCPLTDLLHDQGETSCIVSPDGKHCEHWYDGERCHYCEAAAMTDEQKRAQGMTDG